MVTAYRKLFIRVNRPGRGCALQRPLLLLVLSLVTAAACAPEQHFELGLLWRIERQGVAASYLFGTMHSDHPEVVTLAAPVRRAFQRADAVTLEVSLDAASLLAMAAALVIADGGTLDRLLDAALFERAVAAMEAQGYDAALVARMKPWAVAVALMTPGTRSGMVLDRVLYQRALAEGKPVDGLESVDEQLGLFDSMSMEDQIALLRETLDHLAEFERMLVELRQAWLQRDLARLVEISEGALRGSDPRFAADFARRVILQRNHRMAERMESRLRAGGHFIAVGALHLPGEQGLLELLRQRGYRLTREY